MRYHAYVEPDAPDRIHAPAGTLEIPRVDDHLVRPETREELVRGRAVVAAPAKLPHARGQAVVVSVAEHLTTDDYFCATELLTRAGVGSDFATDACICREGIDPATGGRHVEELAFEVVAEQSLRDITERAQDLTSRGVRRMFAIFVKKGEVCEWSRERNDWVVLDPSGEIEDPALVQPIPIRALLDRAAADDAVARALLIKQNPVLMASAAKARDEGHAQGVAQMSRKAVEGLCLLLAIPFDPERRALLQALDAASLEVLHDRILTEHRWP
jgi:hypothetical protein